MKQKQISQFFGASAKKDEGPKSTQAKISSFFGGGSKTPGECRGSKTPGGLTATPGGADPGATPTPRPDKEADPMDDGGAAVGAPSDAKEPPGAGVAKAEKLSKPATKLPAGGSTSKPKPASKRAGSGDAAKTKAAASGKAKGKASGMKRLRKVVLEDDEEGMGDAATAGLEDDVEDAQLEDSDYEEEASGSDEDFSADEEDDDDEDEDDEEAEEEDEDVNVGGKRKRPPSKASGAAKRLQGGAKGKAAPAGTSELTLGVAASTDGDAARFADRMASRFPFLHPDAIKDAERRRPDDPEYDPRTLHIPPNWFKEAKISEAQQQWWNFKSYNFDSVLLFKVGKFYEMFEMDAYVGVDTLGLTFMKGEQPHAGFPEVKYADMTETPEMLAKRNEQRKQQGKKMCNVVDRQKVAVLSRGTLVDAEMVSSRTDAAYVLAVAEMPVETSGEDNIEVGNGGSIRIGLCAVDAASGQVLLGEFVDDDVRSTLRTQLTSLQPQCLRDRQYFTASAASKAEEEDGKAMAVDSEAGASCAPAPPELDPSKRWPELLQRMVADGVASRPAAMAALGGIIAFLTDCLLDRAVLPLGRFEELPALAPQLVGEAGADGLDSYGPLYMSLNGAALENLEILENNDGGSSGTLLSVLDHCCTPFGRRRLRQWLCRPLGRIKDIEARQDAVAALTGDLAEAAGQARKMLAGVSDLERAITRLHASTVEGALGRDAAHVILYEDAGKRRVAALSGALKDLRSAHAALAKLRAAMQAGAGAGSALLQKIVMERCRPDEVASTLEALESATDWKEAAQTGRAVPEPGVDEGYDAAVDAVDAANAQLQDYMKEVRQKLNCREVSWVSVNKDSHLLEVPDAVAARIGGDFQLVGNRKGYKRYTSTKLKRLVAEYDRVVEKREQALSGILASLVVRFVQHRSLWVGLVEAVAEADALFSLAAHAMSASDGGPMCRPCLVLRAPQGTGGGNGGIFEAVALRHPAGIGGRNNGAFVPNDVCLGGRLRDGAGPAEVEAAPPFVLLSGPNMGGKSTLLRQVCLATVLAQVGACVPAESLTLSPVDALFVRMGARDSIMTGQSTFFIELAETAAMLARATSDSLVALDELGRGTATLDGAAIAGAVLAHLAGTTGCRGLFATHYHHLSDEHAADPRVAVMHMACAVEGAEPGGASASAADGAGPEEVTFLYRLTVGACPKSYGTNVARLAGLPPRVVERAAEVSSRWDCAQQQQPQTEEAQSGAHAMEVDGKGDAGSDTVAAQAPPAQAAGLRQLAMRVQSCLCAGRSATAEQLTQLRELQTAASALLEVPFE
ncbi:hypothetical protein GPECTOR_15g531 [Gonium pectorale]|uniref:DNA mismatch repair protein n=1 Tax=Gonium pectorale TaxID=33097 RepID=A0A150GM65_GONPE|nr:hypothetical protein GPECTOR_15g531 [Gonium pectorale]|eukprot:KXZ50845.1 hypothetical protein GPECTOR_15g531 [Gonium pectorale]